MTPVAIGMLVFSGVMLWGGLAWSLLRLRKHPDLPDLPDHEAPST